MTINVNLSYARTSEIANFVHDKIQSKKGISHSDHELVSELSPRDIEIIISFKNN